jgi:hypothetical protein
MGTGKVGFKGSACFKGFRGFGQWTMDNGQIILAPQDNYRPSGFHHSLFTIHLLTIHHSLLPIADSRLPIAALDVLLIHAHNAQHHFQFSQAHFPGVNGE